MLQRLGKERMIELAKGSIFDSGAVALVNPVNCEGVCGAGLAKEFAERYPDATASYVRLCKLGWVEPGRPFIDYEGDDTSIKIIFFPTKDRWREPSQLEWVANGTRWLRGYLGVATWVPSIAVPALGCGLGGLPWPRVRAGLERVLGELTTKVLLYPPK